MSEDIGQDLKDLRDFLKTPIPDVETLVSHLSSALQSLGLHSTSVHQGKLNADTIRAINRYHPAVQTQLLTSVLPTFLHALDEAQIRLVSTLFVPPKSDSPQTLRTKRLIALSSYLTLPNLLSSVNKATSLPNETRGFALTTLSDLVADYGLNEVYWAIWASRPTDDKVVDGRRIIQWEEAVKAVVGLPGKAGNAVGRWKADGWNGDLPDRLIPRAYFDNMVVRFEQLTYEISQTTASQSDLSLLRSVVQKLASLGLLNTPPSPQYTPDPSFWMPCFPNLLAHLHPLPNSPLPPYPSNFLPSLFLPLPTSTLNSLVKSLIAHLVYHLPTAEPGMMKILPEKADLRLTAAVDVLQKIVGPVVVGDEAWDAVVGSVLDSRNSGAVMDDICQARNRLIASWVNRGGEKAVKGFLDALLEAWTDPKHIRYSLYATQFHLTHILILTLSSLGPYHPHLTSVSHRPRFLMALQGYLSHPDPKIRRLGMLIAEYVSQLTIEEQENDPLQYSQQDEVEELKAGLEMDDDQAGDTKPSKKKAKGKLRRLSFGASMWDGEGDGKEEARWLRSACGVIDHTTSSSVIGGDVWMLGWDRAAPTAPSIPVEKQTARTLHEERGRQAQKAIIKPKETRKIVMLDDAQQADPLEGYDMPSPSSSRSPSPTPSYLEEVAADPSLAIDSTQKKKITRPVYISQLIELLKDRDNPDSLEMGLKWGEGLVRAKRTFGGELTENSKVLATMIIGLNDPFHLDNFVEMRQNLLTALVACSPRTAAPYLAEQYFTGHYSLQQRSVILTALAMGARELAGLPIPNGQINARKIDFPTKTLPAHLHRKYIRAEDHHPSQIDDAVSGLRNMLISKGARKGEEVVPELAREKRLRLGSSKKPLISEIGSLQDTRMMERSQLTEQKPVIPFKDVASECFIMPLINRFWQYFQETSLREERSIRSGIRYRGAGTGMILSPLALEKFLMTLSLLLHSARHSSTFLAILCPEALELAMTIGSSHLPSQANNAESDAENEEERSEAQVVGAALEFCLVCLDGAVDLDRGRSLITDKPALVLGVGEWAMKIFEKEERGERAAGSGGEREGRLRAAAAGVAVKVSEITEKWSGLGMSMR